MPIISQIICDRCQTVKKDTNHWYTLIVTDQDACIRPMALALPVLAPPDTTPGVQYLCGRLCAIEALDRWMADRTTPRGYAGTDLQPHRRERSPPR